MARIFQPEDLWSVIMFQTEALSILRTSNKFLDLDNFQEVHIIIFGMDHLDIYYGILLNVSSPVKDNFFIWNVTTVDSVADILFWHGPPV